MASPGALSGDEVLADVVAALVDNAETVRVWSPTATECLGWTSGEVCGRPLADLVAEPSPGDLREAGEVRLRTRGGRAVTLRYRFVGFGDTGSRLFLAVRADQALNRAQGGAMLDALMAQDRISFVLRGTDLAVERTNVTAAGMPPLTVGTRLADVMEARDAAKAEASLRTVLATGVPIVSREQRVRSLADPSHQWSFLVTALRLDSPRGDPSGVAVFLTDATPQWQAGRRLQLRHRAAARIGASLDVKRTAQDIVDVLVPDFAEFAAVDLAVPVLTGDEPEMALDGDDLRLERAAVRSQDGIWPPNLLQVGMPLPALPPMPQVRRLQQGHTVLVDRAVLDSRLVESDALSQLIPDDGRWLVLAPMFARGIVLGLIAGWRTSAAEAFTAQDADLLTEIATHSALSVDNARRYTREHLAAVALQQRLLPRPTTVTPAIETAGHYLPAAAGGSEIGGDWFDTIALPSLRVALIVGDVIGHGLPATATMGRLRTAVQTLADLELAPDELLTHLDELVARLAAEAGPQHRDTIGGTCLVGLYDPIAGQCTFASAGHPPPVIVAPDGTARLVDLPPGPPLGVGGLPFETTTCVLEPGSVLALYTDGLLLRQAADTDTATARLVQRLAGLVSSGRELAAIGPALTAGPSGPPVRDDTALLLARVRALRPDHVAYWQYPADPATVATARSAAARKLTEWGLEELVFTTELIVSELITNAIRYAGGPLGLRLIRDSVLVCEVSDPSNTQPRLRRARTMDEGGRGLFLVAQVSHRWGSRYGQSGKTIWAEQVLPDAPPPIQAEHR
jgi:PAS domain-containing protein/anti-sigma regulatory factor (Ser/Thr protein kinase)